MIRPERIHRRYIFETILRVIAIAVFPALLFALVCVNLWLWSGIFFYRYDVLMMYEALHLTEMETIRVEKALDHLFAFIPDPSSCVLTADCWKIEHMSDLINKKFVRCERSLFRPGLLSAQLVVLPKIYVDIGCSVMRLYFGPPPEYLSRPATCSDVMFDDALSEGTLVEMAHSDEIPASLLEETSYATKNFTVPFVGVLP